MPVDPDNSSFRRIDNVRRIQRLPREQDFTKTFIRNQIAYAIRNDLKLDMFYADDHAGGKKVLRGYRNVSPATIGIHKTSGNWVFRAFLNEGVSKSKRVPKWRLFRVDRVKSFRVHFAKTYVNRNELYRENDKHMGTIKVQKVATREEGRRRWRRNRNN